MCVTTGGGRGFLVLGHCRLSFIVVYNNFLIPAKTQSSVEGLMELMRHLGSAYLELSRYNNRNAIKLLQEEVSFQHRNSAWIQGLLGKLRNVSILSYFTP